MSSEGIVTKPLPRYRRVEAGPPLVLQGRDLALLEDVWRYRLLSTSQLETLRASDQKVELRFPSRLTLTRRLKLLYHNRYLTRIPRPLAKGSQEPVYVLDREGAKALSREHGEVQARTASQLPKAAALEHLLAVNQVRLSLQISCAGSPDTQLLAWHSSDTVKFSVATAPQPGERAYKVRLIPDGFLSMRVLTGNQGTPSRQAQRLFYFVELDLGGESSRVLLDKCRTYYLYWHSGGFAHDFHLPQGVGFRVLFVVPTVKRSQTVLSAIRHLTAGQSMFWVTEQAHMTPKQILQPIWRSHAGSRHAGNGYAEGELYDLKGAVTHKRVRT
ncbi:MAG TPA: replication-relaxation family protein [Abditibacteriaceae bacterium]